MRERVAYLHIPKTAGVSVRAALGSRFTVPDTVPWAFDSVLFGGFERLAELPGPVFTGDRSDLQNYRYMTGHFMLPTMLMAFDPLDVLCLVREPRSRLLSHYTFWRSWSMSEHDTWGDYDASRHALRPLGEFCTEPRVAHQTDNLVTRMILGPHPLIPVDGFISPSHIDGLAREACAIVDSLGCVDLLERGDSAFAAIEAWLGAEVERVHANATQVTHDLPIDLGDLALSTTQSAIYDRSVCDLQIWQHVAASVGLSDSSAQRLAASTCASMLVRVSSQVVQPVAAVTIEPQPPTWVSAYRAVRARIAKLVSPRRRRG